MPSLASIICAACSNPLHVAQLFLWKSEQCLWHAIINSCKDKLDTLDAHMPSAICVCSCTVLCKLVGTLKVLASSTCSN